MVSRCARFATALGLVLAGCAVSSQGAGTIPAFSQAMRLPPPRQAPASSISHAAPVQGVQVASLQPVAGEVAPLVRQGTVLWHREEAAVPAATPTPPAVNAELEQLKQNFNQLQTQTQAALKQNQDMRNQALTAVTSVAQMSRQALQAADARAVEESRKAAQEAKVFTAEQLAQANSNTAKVLAQVYQQAGRHAEQIAEAKTAPVAAKVAQLEQTSVQPQQVQAIALQSLRDSKDYIKTVTRNTIQDESDPAMTQALADAASSVITRNNKVVFAIRRAVAEELQTVAKNGQAAHAATRLGPDHHDADTVAIDADHLKIGQLLAPGSQVAAEDAAAGADLAAISPAAGGSAPAQLAMLRPATGQASLRRASARTSWMDIRQYKVIVHQDNQSLQKLLSEVISDAEPFVGPWQIKWKLSEENKGLLNEKFSLDAETNFDEFLSYLSQYVMNDRGVKLSFSLFDTDRIIVISD